MKQISDTLQKHLFQNMVIMYVTEKDCKIMELNFERGDKYQPKGHALLYFTSNINETWATYLMTMPILVDLSKYVPPFLSAQIGNVESTDMSAFAFPPSPELIPNLEELYHLAEIRDDDVIYGGVINTNDVTDLLYKVNEIIQIYSADCKNIAPHLNVSNQTSGEIDEPSSSSEEGYLYFLCISPISNIFLSIF